MCIRFDSYEEKKKAFLLVLLIRSHAPFALLLLTLIVWFIAEKHHATTQMPIQSVYYQDREYPIVYEYT